MSDTKALYDVVEKALANWGNSEAQDALEALMGRLRGAEESRDHAVDMMRSARHTLDALASLHEIGDHAYQELACHLRDEPNGHEGERIVTRAEADNAVLLSLVRQAIYGNGKGGCTECGRNGGCEEGCEMAREAAAHHPGAALLEELEGLRKQVSALKEAAACDEMRTLPASREAHSVWASFLDDPHHALPRLQGLLDERDAAHNAALEEAAKLFAYALPVPVASDTVQYRIRALKKTGQGA